MLCIGSEETHTLHIRLHLGAARRHASPNLLPTPQIMYTTGGSPTGNGITIVRVKLVFPQNTQICACDDVCVMCTRRYAGAVRRRPGRITENMWPTLEATVRSSNNSFQLKPKPRKRGRNCSRMSSGQTPTQVIYMVIHIAYHQHSDVPIPHACVSANFERSACVSASATALRHHYGAERRPSTPKMSATLCACACMCEPIMVIVHGTHVIRSMRS